MKLTKVMEEKGYTLTRLAAESGVSKATLSRYMRGLRTPNLVLLKKLAKTLGVELMELIDD